MKLAPIIDFNVDGKGMADFYSEEVKMWDYKKFADRAREVIEKEIVPMRQHLVSYDMEINKLRERLNSDSVSVRSDLTKLIDKLLYGQLKKFDADPLPMLVFALKTTDLEYRSTVLEHKPLRDSADIHLQVKMLNQEMKVLTKLDSAATSIPEEKVEEKLLDYADFIKNTYSNAPVLKSYLKTLREFGLREQKKKQALLDHYAKSLNYIVDGADSIPLSSEIASPFKPLVITPEKFTLGLSLADTTKVQGYFYTINAARKPEVKALFPVDQTAFNKKNLVASKGLVYSDAGGQIYYVLLYSTNKAKEKYPASLAKIYRSDGLAWKIDQPLAFTPNELILKPDTGEVVITDGVQRVVVDKNGKALK